MDHHERHQPVVEVAMAADIVAAIRRLPARRCMRRTRLPALARTMPSAAIPRSDGTYVALHHATNPNVTKNDNYSTRGNVNPYTGKAGTKPRDGE